MMLGERRGGLKREVCPRCNEVVCMQLDHGLNQWCCPECDLS